MRHYFHRSRSVNSFGNVKRELEVGEGYSPSPLPWISSNIFHLVCLFFKFNAESKWHDFMLSCFDYPAAKVGWCSARVRFVWLGRKLFLYKKQPIKYNQSQCANWTVVYIRYFFLNFSTESFNSIFSLESWSNYSLNWNLMKIFVEG